MNFEIQALGGKLIGSRSALKTLDRLTTLLPKAKINFEVIPPPETKKAEFESDEDDDDIMHDPDIQEMVKNGEHTCHMFDAHCQACEDDEEDEEDEDEEYYNDEVRVLTEEEVLNDPEMTAQVKDDDDITLAELKEQLEDNMTLAEIQQQLDKVEAAKKRLETIRLKKEKKEEGELHFESEAEYLRWDALRPFGWLTTLVLVITCLTFRKVPK